MRRPSWLLTVVVVAGWLVAGCASDGAKPRSVPVTPPEAAAEPVTAAPDQPATPAPAPAPATPTATVTTTAPAAERAAPAAKRAAFTAKDNPTAAAGRGEPDLEDFFRPAAWVFVSGRGGKFIEKDGHPQVQWFIDGAVGPSPTFRIEAYEPLLGTPKDVSCTLDSLDSEHDAAVAYAFAAKPGTFEPGREYSLLRPGENFLVRNRFTGDVVSEIPALPPGNYVLLTAVKNLETSKEGLAITYFTVASGDDR